MIYLSVSKHERKLCMKKLLCVFISILLVFGTVIPAFAENERETENYTYEYPLVIVRGINFNGLYLDYGTGNQKSCIASPGFSEIMKLIGGLTFTFLTKYTLNVDAVLEFVDGMLGTMSGDKNGDSLYNVSAPEYPLAVSNYPDLKKDYEGYNGDELGLLHGVVDRYGADNVYYLSYDWRLDPSDTADKLNAMVELAKKEHNTDKVDLICCSMGGIVTDCYMYEYGTDSLNSVVFDSSTFCGTYVATDLFRGKVLITENMLYNFAGNYIKSNFFLKVLSFLGVFKLASKLAMGIVDKYKDEIYDKFLIDTFATLPGFWSIVQHEDYDECIDYLFPTDELKAEYAGLIAKADKLQEIAAASDDIILSLPEKGVKVAVIAAYNTQMIPVYESAIWQSDGTLESPLMLGRAVVSETGSTLGDDYVAANPEKLSPDRCVDLSGALFPDYTWAVKDAGHVIGTYGSDLSDMIFWILAYDGQPTVNTNPLYPQFIKSDANETISYFN